jgi:hypothetical protein
MHVCMHVGVFVCKVLLGTECYWLGEQRFKVAVSAPVYTLESGELNVVGCEQVNIKHC